MIIIAITTTTTAYSCDLNVQTRVQLETIKIYDDDDMMAIIIGKLLFINLF